MHVSHGGCVHYVMLFRIQWKPFWLATQLYPETGWLSGKLVWTMTYAHKPDCHALEKGSEVAWITVGRLGRQADFHLSFGSWTWSCFYPVFLRRRSAEKQQLGLRSSTNQRVVLFGSGFVARPLLQQLTKSNGVSVHVGKSVDSAWGHPTVCVCLISYCWYNPQPMRKNHSIAGTTILQTTLEDAENTQFYWWYDKSGDKGSNWTLRRFGVQHHHQSAAATDW